MATGETAAAPRVAPHVDTGVCGDTRKFNGKNRLIFSPSCLATSESRSHIHVPMSSATPTLRAESTLQPGWQHWSHRLGKARKKRFGYDNPRKSTICFPWSTILALARWDQTQRRLHYLGEF